MIAAARPFPIADFDLRRELARMLAALLLVTTLLAPAGDIPAGRSIEIVGAQNPNWFLTPVLAADQLGGEDGLFYTLGMPYGARMQPHMFGQLRDFIFWGSFGPDVGRKAAPALALWAWFHIDPASARIALAHGGQGLPALPACPQGSYTNPEGVPDGCGLGPTGTPNGITLVQHSNWFSGYANQSGQTYTSSHPPIWNVVGADFPTGISTSTIFKDPATATLTSGYTYSATGSSLGTPIINGNAANPVFDSFDFSGTLIGTHGAVLVNMTGAGASGVIKILNSYIAIDAANKGNSNHGNAIFVYQISGSIDFDIEYSLFNFSQPPLTGAGSGFKPLSVPPNANDTFNFVAFITIPQNPINGNAANFNLFMYYPYVDSYVCDVANQNHAEVTDLNGNPGTRPKYYWWYPNILRGNGCNGLGSGTANIWISPASGNANFNDVQVLNSITIDNCAGGVCPGATMAQNISLVSSGTDLISSIVYDNNQFDSSGSLFIIRVNDAICTTPLSLQRGYNLKSGSALPSAMLSVTDGTQSFTASMSDNGNGTSNMTVTAVASGTLQLNYRVRNGSTIYGRITQFLTGTGNTGTYLVNVDQNLASTALTGDDGCGP